MKKILAVLTTALLALGLTVVAVAGPASAHANNMDVGVACNTTNYTWTVSWSVTNDMPDLTETITASSDTALIPIGTTLAKGETKVFTETMSTPTTKTLTIEGSWSDKFVKSDSTQLKSNSFKTCTPQHVPVTLCHASPSDTGANGWNTIKTDDDGALGHAAQHAADIIPAFTYWVKQNGSYVQTTFPGKNLGTVYSGFTGQQILTAGCDFPPVVPTAPTFVDVACTTPGNYGQGSYTIPGTIGVQYQVKVGNGNYSNVSAGTVAVSAGTTITVKALAKNGFTLTGTTQWSHAFSAPADCRVSVTPDPASFADAICTGPGTNGDGSYTIPSTTGVQYQVKIGSGSFGDVAAGTYPVAVGTVVTVQAVAKTGYKLTGTASWGPYTVLAPASCLVSVDPVEPTVVVIDGCGTYGSVTPADTVGVTYTVWPKGVTEGSYRVTATADSGYVLTPGAQSTWFGRLGHHTTCVTPDPPKVKQAMCTGPGEYGDGRYTIPWTKGVDYQVSTDGVHFTDKHAGTHTMPVGTTIWVRAVADHGYSFDTDAVTSWGPFTFVSPGDCLERTWAHQPDATDQVCNLEGGTTSGSITVTGATGVSYTIHRTDAVAADIVVADGTTNVDPGSYTVTATPLAGYKIRGTTSWPLTVAAATDCELPTHAFLPGSASAVSERCVAGAPTSGYIQIDPADGLSYFVGTTQLVAAHTPMAPGTYTVTAVAAPGDAIDGPDSWVLTIAALAASCDPATLAFTGFDGGVGYLTAAAVFLLLGATFVALSRKDETRA